MSEDVLSAGSRPRGLTPSQLQVMTAVDYWIAAVETVYRAARKNDLMEAASKAQSELERIEKQIAELQAAAGDNQQTQQELTQLRGRVDALRRQMSGQLTAWERAELARHPNRPYPLDYIELIFPDFSEIHGDRAFGDDPAMVCGMARFRGREVMVHRHPEGPRHQATHLSQLRPAQSRGLSQGATRDSSLPRSGGGR